jgi:AcrR family transcriptional regulator
MAETGGRTARSYMMRGRARAAERTRARIVEAAHALLGRPGATGLTLQEVADAAGVTRATIYKSIGSRRDLLAAVFEDQGRRIDYDRVHAAAADPDVARALVSTVRESGRVWSVMPDAIRKTLALAVQDAEVGELVARYEAYRRDEMAALARRAHRSGVLGAGVSAAQAATMLVLLTSFAAYDVLRSSVGEGAAVRHLVRSARAVLGIRGQEASGRPVHQR